MGFTASTKIITINQLWWNTITNRVPAARFVSSYVRPTPSERRRRLPTGNSRSRPQKSEMAGAQFRTASADQLRRHCVIGCATFHINHCQNHCQTRSQKDGDQNSEHDVGTPHAGNCGRPLAQEAAEVLGGRTCRKRRTRCRLGVSRTPQTAGKDRPCPGQRRTHKRA